MLRKENLEALKEEGYQGNGLKVKVEKFFNQVLLRQDKERERIRQDEERERIRQNKKRERITKMKQEKLKKEEP